MDDNMRPPRFSRRLFERLASSMEKSTIGGDMIECFYDLAERRGVGPARRWFRLQVLRSLPDLLRHSLLWSLIMLKNYLKIALRNLARRKGFSILNLAGLALGLACCILIFLWVQDEWRFDRFHENREDVFRVYTEVTHSEGPKEMISNSFYPLARVLKEEVAGTEHATRFANRSDMLFRTGDRTFSNDSVGFVDPAFLEIFTFPVIKGDPRSALAEPQSLVMTRSAARKYFGEADPLGQVLTVNDQYDVRVTAVLADIPQHSSLRFDLLCPFALLFGPGGKEPSHWGGNPLETYVFLRPDAPLLEYEARMTETVLRHMGELPPNLTAELKLQSLTRLHLYALDGGGLITFISIFSIIAVFVLVIACVNFMNLTTARAGTRAGEVGLRKVVGANRADLIRQFLGEAVLYALTSFVIALGLVRLALPLFNQVAGKQLSLDPAGLMRSLPWLLPVVLGAGILAGSYPAFYLSAFQPVRVIKGGRMGKRGSDFRRVLVVGQFVTSIFLMIATIVIQRQLTYMRGKDLGYDREQLVCMRLPGDFDSLRSRFLQHPAVLKVSASLQNPLWITSTVGKMDWEGKDPARSLSFNWDNVDYDYIDVMKMEIVEGRAFSREYATDEGSAYILNQEAVRVMGIDSPVGKRFRMFDTEGTVIGVVKDFHFESLHHRINPLILHVDSSWLGMVYARIRPGNTSAALEHMRGAWEDLHPGRPFRYFFLDDRIQVLYRAEQRMGGVFRIFTGLAIVISCLGIFGLAAYMAERRTKEIGIRKVLGATSGGIVRLLSRDFSRWVLLANLLAWPAAWLATSRWLEGFAYRSPLEPWIFVLAGAAALAVALLTAGGQALRAARTDPARSLRFE